MSQLPAVEHVDTLSDPHCAAPRSTMEEHMHPEIGMIPKHWDVQPLGSLLAEPPCYGVNAAAVPFDDSLPAYIRITDIGDDNRYRPSPKVSVRGLHGSRFHLRQGDLVFARTGASVGKSYLYDSRDGRLAFAGFLIRVTPNHEKLDPRYIAYFAQSHAYWQWIAANSARSGQPGINSNEYGSLPVPLPTLPEQRAIASVLSDIDDLIQSLEVLIAKRRAIKRATMQQLLTGRTRLPGFDGAWAPAKLGTFVSIRDCKASSREVDEDVLCVELEHIGQGSGRIERHGLAGTTSSLKYAFEAGDVLFGRLRSYLRKWWYADSSGICSTEIWPLVADRRLADSVFVYHLVQTNRFLSAAGISYGTHMPRADWKIMSEVEFALPPLPEQRAIAAILSDMDAEIAALEARLDKIRAIKHGTMQQLLTGATRLPIPDDHSEDDHHDA